MHGNMTTCFKQQTHFNVHCSQSTSHDYYVHTYSACGNTCYIFVDTNNEDEPLNYCKDLTSTLTHTDNKGNDPTRPITIDIRTSPEHSNIQQTTNQINGCGNYLIYTNTDKYHSRTKTQHILQHPTSYTNKRSSMHDTKHFRDYTTYISTRRQHTPNITTLNMNDDGRPY